MKFQQDIFCLQTFHKKSTCPPLCQSAIGTLPPSSQKKKARKQKLPVLLMCDIAMVQFGNIYLIVSVRKKIQQYSFFLYITGYIVALPRILGI